MKMFRLEAKRKCGGCNWEVTYVYVLADTEKEAKQLYRKGEAGLCGSCIGDMLSECGYEILPKPPEGVTYLAHSLP